jgi:tetratricopeptide (TPR) repeat protein
LGRRAEAKAAYRRALKLQEKLAAEHPAVPQYRLDLAGSYVNFGSLLREQGQTQAPLDWYAKALPLLQTLLAKDARLATARIYLRNAHWGRAQVLAQLGRPAESAKDWQQAAELDDGRMRPYFRLQQSFALARAGEHRKAVGAVEEVLESSTQGANAPRSGALLFDAACIYALSASAVTDDAKLREHYAVRAIALLHQARQGGFFKDPKQLDNVRKDPDLNALRQREDFKKFLAELK